MLRAGGANFSGRWASLPSLGAQRGTIAEKSSSGKRFASWLSWSLRGSENISYLPGHLEKGLANWDWGPTPAQPHGFAGIASLEWSFQSREVGMGAWCLAEAKTLAGPRRKSCRPIPSLEWIGAKAHKLRPSWVAFASLKSSASYHCFLCPSGQSSGLPLETPLLLYRGAQADPASCLPFLGKL